MFSIKNVTYSKVEMINALNDYVENHGDKEMDEITALVDNIVSKDITRKEINKKIADYHGITVSDLVSSPNMERLEMEHSEFLLDKIYNEITEYGLNDIQATSCLYFAVAGTD